MSEVSKMLQLKSCIEAYYNLYKDAFVCLCMEKVDLD